MPACSAAAPCGPRAAAAAPLCSLQPLLARAAACRLGRVRPPHPTASQPRGRAGRAGLLRLPQRRQAPPARQCPRRVCKKNDAARGRGPAALAAAGALPQASRRAALPQAVAASAKIPIAGTDMMTDKKPYERVLGDDDGRQLVPCDMPGIRDAPRGQGKTDRRSQPYGRRGLALQNKAGAHWTRGRRLAKLLVCLLGDELSSSTT
jgi:hypothetical protein